MSERERDEQRDVALRSSQTSTGVSLRRENPARRHLRSRRGVAHVGLIAVIAVVAVVVIIVGAGFGLGWFNAKSNSASGTGCNLPSSTPISGAGSTLVAPLMLAWASLYTASTVSYSSIGSGGGINDITQKTVDFGASDAPLSPTQRKAVPSPGVVTVPESIGGVVPIYNLPSVSKTLNFTGQILAAIYLGDITNWNNTALQAANPHTSLPNAAITVVHRSDGSGTTFAYTSYLSAENSTWASTVGHATSVSWPTGVGASGNQGVTSTVKSTPNAIGYVDINYALTQGVAFGAVRNPAGNNIIATIANIASAVADSHVVLPAPTGDWYNVTVENALGASDYPIATLTYVFVYTDMGQAYGSGYSLTKAENVVDFLNWVVYNGQNTSAPLYYVPLPATIVASDAATIHTLTYNGASIPVCVPNTSGSA